MHRTRIKAGTNLNSRQYLQATGMLVPQCLNGALKGIVICDRYGVKARLVGDFDDLCGRKRPIRGRRVDVEIDIGGLYGDICVQGAQVGSNPKGIFRGLFPGLAINTLCGYWPGLQAFY